MTNTAREKAKLGRSNRDNNPIFYCSNSKEAVFLEVPLIKGDELILSFWQTSEKVLVNNIGYTQGVFDKLGAKRACPAWTTTGASSHQDINFNMTPSLQEMMKALPEDKNKALQQIISEAFMCTVGSAENYKYKLTTAIAELHFWEIQNSSIPLAGIMYPSIKTCANGDNFALLPSFVKQHLNLRKALHIKIDNIEGEKISITYLDSAKEFSSNGNLQWLRRLPNWTLLPNCSGRITFTLGLDQDGDYSISKEGERCHWVVVDTLTDKVIEPC